MTPDGTDRKPAFDLPRGFFYTMPAFFPGDGSTDSDANHLLRAKESRAVKES